MPSCTGGAAHFADKPIGVGECGPIKSETFPYCNELPRVSLSEIKSEHTESYRFKQSLSRSSLCVFGGEFDGPWCLFGQTGGREDEELSRASDNGKFGGFAGRLNVLIFMN
jgi:hypothetical protein